MAIDWTKSMKQRFEYYIVDPTTWGNLEKLDTIISCSISRDSSKDTLGSANFDTTEPISENYIRVYLVAEQDGVEYRETLGTFLVETPSVKFNGKYSTISLDGYTPLIELKENTVPTGYAIFKSTSNAPMYSLEEAYKLCREHGRALVIDPESEKTLKSHFVAEDGETWLSFISGLLETVDYKFGLEPNGTITFEPIQDASKLHPIFTYNDDNSSIISQDITLSKDLFGIPNVVSVTVKKDSSSKPLNVTVKNTEAGSPISTVSRGREIVYRVSNPSGLLNATKAEITAYAKKLLVQLSTVECKLTYTHGYCPVRVGDAVLLNYKAAGLENVKAVVQSQSISCKTGCQVSETATYTEVLFEGRTT